MSSKLDNTEKGVRDFPRNSENPFLPNLLFPTKKSNAIISSKSEKVLVDMQTGQIDDSLFIAVRKEIDKEQFVKIFQNHMQAIFDLSRKALKVFSYIASVVEFSDKIIFEIEKCSKHTGYTKATIFSGLAELLEKEFIAKSTVQNVYYINPQIFYRGDRLVLIQDIRKKHKDKIEKNSAEQLPLFDTQD
jgi:hypothetical protein